SALREAARVNDEYRDWQRVVGLYPLTALAFSHGIRRWQESARQTFATPLMELPLRGALVRYVPLERGALTRAEVAQILARSEHNPLRIPEPDAADKERLFAAFAPAFEIDVASDDDRIGAPRRDHGPVIDIAQPVVYRYLSHTRYQGRNLLQLNYTIWFPARPRDGVFDLLGGRLDGVTWRVTLTPDGEPWVYDAMHNCGCYHLFFPASRAVTRVQPHSIEEQAFIPQAAPETQASYSLTLRIAARTHYIQRVLAGPAAPAPSVTYQWADYEELRSLPAPHGRSSLFQGDGIVAGSERRERFLFWPMGIPNPGAMRQRGRHATAFVGKRHFDDADLLERYFEMTQQSFE
ncbi:MAG: hypothetical protein M1392_01410, partial [Gammaproteobacteria bacterium]|nr:hypothetical protein [Gammaproteobacteria bacterium]